MGVFMHSNKTISLGPITCTILVISIFLDHQFVTGWSSAVHGTLYTISIAKCDIEVIINIHRNPSYHRGLICNPPHHHQRIKVLLNFSQFFNCLVICSKEEVLYLFPPLSTAPLGSRYSDFASMF